MLFWESSGRMESRDIPDVINENTLTTDEMNKLINNFQNEMDYNQPLFSCGACGVRRTCLIEKEKEEIWSTLSLVWKVWIF